MIKMEHPFLNMGYDSCDWAEEEHLHFYPWGTHLKQKVLAPCHRLCKAYQPTKAPILPTVGVGTSLSQFFNWAHTQLQHAHTEENMQKHPINSENGILSPQSSYVIDSQTFNVATLK